MKRLFKYTLAAVGLTCMALPTVAQETLRSAYFLEGSTYRHKLNPALAPDRAYFSFPVLGNVNINTSSNIGLSDFIYPTADGGLTTFMNSSVSNSEFMDNLKDRNRMNLDLNLNLLSVGFRAFKGYNTIDLSLHAGAKMNIPRDFFAFAKEGMSSANTVYEFDDLGMSMNAWVDLALGHTHRINDDWVVGGKVKLLFGAGKADIKINHMRMTMAEDKWAIEGDGEMNAAVAGLKLPTKAENGKTEPGSADADEIDWDDMDVDGGGLGGFGLAFDLGATYKVYEDLEVSAAILDLGFISWKDNIQGKMGMEPWTFDGFHDVAVDEDNGKELEDQLEDLGDQLEECVNFQKVKSSGSRTTALAATLNLGAQYTLPYYRNLKFGFLSSTKINGPYSWSEGRFSANVTPVKCFGASINYCISSFGSSLGWMLNLNRRGFSMFVGSDHQFFKVTPQYIPVNDLNLNISFGVNFTLGSRKNI